MTGLREYLAPEVNEALEVRPSKLGGAAVALGVAYAALEAWKIKAGRAPSSGS